jgi:membrane fusion protein, multidrug efflux system
MHIFHAIKQRKKTSVSVITLLFLIGAWSFYKKTHPIPTPPPEIKRVEVEHLNIRTLQHTTTFIGTIRAKQATLLESRSKGIIKQFVQSGQHVKKGALIAQIENKAVEKNHALSNTLVHLAHVQYKRFNQLYQQGIVSKNAVDEKKSLWIEARKRRADALMALDEINVYAPFDGIIGMFKCREGSQVQAGTPLVSIYDPSSMMVEFDVPSSLLKHIHDGSRVYIHKKPYQIDSIQHMLDEDTHMSPAFVNIHCDACIIGSTIEVAVVLREKKLARVISNSSLFLRDNQPFIYVVHDGKTKQVPVRIGIREKQWVEITSTLNQNLPIIVVGQARLYPGEPVHIANEGGKL